MRKTKIITFNKGVDKYLYNKTLTNLLESEENSSLVEIDSCGINEEKLEESLYEAYDEGFTKAIILLEDTPSFYEYEQIIQEECKDLFADGIIVLQEDFALDAKQNQWQTEEVLGSDGKKYEKKFFVEGNRKYYLENRGGKNYVVTYFKFGPENKLEPFFVDSTGKTEPRLVTKDEIPGKPYYVDIKDRFYRIEQDGTKQYVTQGLEEYQFMEIAGEDHYYLDGEHGKPRFYDDKGFYDLNEETGEKTYTKYFQEPEETSETNFVYRFIVLPWNPPTNKEGKYERSFDKVQKPAGYEIEPYYYNLIDDKIKDYAFSLGPVEVIRKFFDNDFFASLDYKTATSASAFLGELSKFYADKTEKNVLKESDIIEILVPKYLETLFNSDPEYTIPETTTVAKFVYYDTSEDAFKQGQDVRKLILGIIKDFNEKKFEIKNDSLKKHLLSVEGVSLSMYVTELLLEITHTLNDNGNGEVLDQAKRAELLKNWRTNVFSTLGITNDLTSFFNELNTHGLGLVTDIVNIAVTRYKAEKDAKKSVKEQKEDRRQALVSHKNYDKLLELLPKTVIAQEGSDKFAKAIKTYLDNNKNGLEKVEDVAKTIMDKVTPESSSTTGDA